MDAKYSNADDSLELTEEARGVAAESKSPEKDQVAADPLAGLQAEVTSLREESARWHDRFLRKAAELENYRKRIEKERKDWSYQAKSAVILEFLPIMDSCERALRSLEGAAQLDPDLEQYKQGVELLYKQLGDTLNRLGVKPIEATGQRFDPNLHEAMTRMETTEYDENTVISELTPGYTYMDRLLRPVQVVVAALPKPEDIPGQ
jgi:molecular chaperone GrpE